MTIKLRCSDYGFECDFVLDGKKSISLLKKFKEHVDSEHGIDYSMEAIIQMVVNKGHARETIRNE
jgi:predicted small metal-binding protein